MMQVKILFPSCRDRYTGGTGQMPYNAHRQAEQRSPLCTQNRGKASPKKEEESVAKQ